LVNVPGGADADPAAGEPDGVVTSDATDGLADVPALPALLPQAADASASVTANAIGRPTPRRRSVIP
jgi:hypothetical protein